jgi:chromosomal replication initiator protein
MRQHVTKDDMDIVAALPAALAAKVGRERFELWFGRAVKLHLAGGVLVVTAPDQFTLDRLRGNFRQDIAAVCEELLGIAPAIEFRIGQSLAQSPTEASNDADESVPQTIRLTARTSSDDQPARRRFASLNAFVVGDGNRVAYTAAQMTQQRPGSVTPLFLYGPAGCGKTHLLEGIWTDVRRSSRTRRVVMLSAEQFTSHFLEALHGSGLPSFRRKYRDVEVLLIDDVQFFAGKKATLVELLHTTDTLLREGRQVVLAADRSPAELHSLGSDLTARMSGGLVCNMEPADAATRIGIARQLAAQREMAAPPDVLDWVATQLTGDARLLSGALNRLQATSHALARPITLELAEQALADIIRSTRRAVRLPDIERAVCDTFGLEPDALHSGRRMKNVSHPRMLAMWLARKHTRAALSEIGQYFGRRSHSTVISAEKKITRLMTDNAPFALAHGTCPIEDAIRRVEAQLRTG